MASYMKCVSLHPHSILKLQLWECEMHANIIQSPEDCKNLICNLVHHYESLSCHVIHPQKVRSSKGSLTCGSLQHYYYYKKHLTRDRMAEV